jgi:hypothetical protein
VWSSLGGRSLYRLTLTEGSGRAVWLHETSDTSAVVPGDVGLVLGERYYWYVDALDSSGASLTTGTRRFTIAP